MTEVEFRDFELDIALRVQSMGAVVPRTGIWIRGHLLDVESDYVWHMYRTYRTFARQVPYNPGKYQTFRNYFFVCKALGLVEVDRKEDSAYVYIKKSPKVFYRLVEDKLDDEAWENPFAAYRILLEERREAQAPPMRA